MGCDIVHEDLINTIAFSYSTESHRITDGRRLLEESYGLSIITLLLKVSRHMVTSRLISRVRTQLHRLRAHSDRSPRPS